MKYSLLILLMFGIATPSHGTSYINYSWEDGGTVLDVHPDPDLPSIIATNVNRGDGHPVHQSLNPPWFNHTPGYPFPPDPWEPSYCSLRLEQNDPGGSSAAYLAYLRVYGHSIPALTATVWYYVKAPNEPLSVRLWGRFCSDLPDNPHQNDGDAGGIQVDNFEPGWHSISWAWPQTWGLVVEFWVDGEVGNTVYLDEIQFELDANSIDWGEYDLWIPSGLVKSVSKSLDDIPQPTVELQAFPNPFNPQTTISFSLDKAVWAKVEIYDLIGRHVASLADQSFSKGSHSFTWIGRDVQGRAMPSGTYIVRLETESGAEAKKISLIR